VNYQSHVGKCIENWALLSGNFVVMCAVHKKCGRNARLQRTHGSNETEITQSNREKKETKTEQRTKYLKYSFYSKFLVLMCLWFVFRMKTKKKLAKKEKRTVDRYFRCCCRQWDCNKMRGIVWQESPQLLLRNDERDVPTPMSRL
jgi:hypothetical protein